MNVFEADRSKGSTHGASFAANFGTTDLTAQVEKPDHGAYVEFHNQGAAVENAVWTDFRGTVHTTPLSPGERYPTDIVVDAIDSTSGANVSAEAYWYAIIGHTINEAP